MAKKKLTLAKETLRRLSDSALQKAAGGWYGPGYPTGNYNCGGGGGCSGGGGTGNYCSANYCADTGNCPQTQEYPQCWTQNYQCSPTYGGCPSNACATRDYTGCEECNSEGYTGCHECNTEPF